MASNGAVNGNGQAELNALKKDESRVPVHSFDPEASPAQKGAEAGQARDQLKSISEKTQGVARGECHCLCIFACSLVQRG